jgi:hypothetical protein
MTPSLPIARGLDHVLTRRGLFSDNLLSRYNSFKLVPVDCQKIIFVAELTMTIDPGQRAYRLVEELRAEVDFEIDDVISEIVRSLPEEYFTALAHDDQLIHLKALLAISICNLRDRITLRSDNGRHVAVVARQNYPGMLAKIIADLPRDQTLIGAKIFTSKAHDFIIDLFDFQSESTEAGKSSLSRLELDDLVTEVSGQTGATNETVRQFIQSYPSGSPIVGSATEVIEHFRAYLEAQHASGPVVNWQLTNHAKVTIASTAAAARDLFLASAQALSNLHADIDQAFLYDFPLPGQKQHIAVASFISLGDFSKDHQQYQKYLHDCLSEI